jgi:hypothetical protein
MAEIARPMMRIPQFKATENPMAWIDEVLVTELSTVDGMGCASRVDVRRGLGRARERTRSTAVAACSHFKVR